MTKPDEPVMQTKLDAMEENIHRHEAIIEQMRATLSRIESAVVRMEEHMRGRTIPGDSECCRLHQKQIDQANTRIDALEDSIQDLRSTIAKWMGGLAVLTFLVGIGLAVLKIVM